MYTCHPLPLSCPPCPPRAIQLHNLSLSAPISFLSTSPHAYRPFFLYSPFVFLYPVPSSEPTVLFLCFFPPSSCALPSRLVSMETPHMSPTTGVPFSSYKLQVLPTIACGMHWNWSVGLLTISTGVEKQFSHQPKINVLHPAVVMFIAHFMPFPYCIYPFMGAYCVI